MKLERRQGKEASFWAGAMSAMQSITIAQPPAALNAFSPREPTI
jgi:hypothetical protein